MATEHPLSDKIRSMFEELEKNVANMFTNEKYMDYLDAMSRLHTYSAVNVSMIFAQNPDAKRVAGFHTWRKLGRHVSPGEHGIAVFAPVFGKPQAQTDPETGKPILDEAGKPIMERPLKGYKYEYVWDISQTIGEEIPFFERKITGTPDDETERAFMKEITESPGIIFTDKPLPKGADWFFKSDTAEVYIKDTLTSWEKLNRLVFAKTYRKFHDDADVNTSEAQLRIVAESVAYVTCAYFGADQSGYSIPNVADWSSGRDVTELRKALTLIQKEAQKNITAIESRLPEKVIAKPQPAAPKKTTHKTKIK